MLELKLIPVNNTNSVGIRLHLKGSGTVWFDDTSFTVDPNPPPPPINVTGPNARQPANPVATAQAVPGSDTSPQAAATPANSAAQSGGTPNSASSGDASTVTDNRVNLIENGDFEEKPVDANGWSTEGNGTYLWADDEMHGGTHSVKISGLNVNGSFTNIPHSINAAAIWQNPTVPTYAFTVPADMLQFRDERPLTRQEINSVDNYVHNIDNIHLMVGDHDPGSVLVVQETAFPGWDVSVNGKPAQIESAGGLIAVRLPDNTTNTDQTTVVFTYRPPLLYASALISVLAIAILIAYMLRLDRLVPLRVKRQAAALAERAEHSITQKRSSRYDELLITPIHQVPDSVLDDPLLVERVNPERDNNNPDGAG
ncbi:MAG TPA: hypothetical protein VKQ72_20705, partial [Aggregatilineales bacterium]|nr:hypothetical protein [Aggregatilineales bacterium]